ncbi:MAG TPA: glutamine-hydrolyzing GMP synthase [Chloroflexota bacterium]|nr:glutamine-hydrolyzing GMP synthase [Chloroflexota bacterium]
MAAVAEEAQAPSTPAHGSPAARRDTILVLDFGAQYSRLIARRVRECRVYCEVLPWDAPAAQIRALEPKGIILSGGPASVYEPGAPTLPEVVLELGVPVLGICYGMQLLAHRLGGTVAPGDRREFGHAVLRVGDSGHPLFSGLPATPSVWMSHGDKVESLPPGFTGLASTTTCKFAAMATDSGDGRRIAGVQFHPEVAHTPQGLDLLQNFCYALCGCEPTWTPGSFVAEAVGGIRAQVGSGRVLCGVSGGVDSSVAAALIHRAVGDQLTCVFVDHGLLRKNEGATVVRTFREHLGFKLSHVDASEDFLEYLSCVTDPEMKRTTIGERFIRTFEREARRLAEQEGEFAFLAQGTLYPDVIESATPGTHEGKAAKIKTHHNVGGLPKDLGFKLIEPLRYLFKDEARAVGTELGLPDEIVWRDPFPGPGLAVRVLGEVTDEKLSVLREADAIFVEEVKAAGLYRSLGQVFAVLTDSRSTGVMGDYRTYGHVVALRAITTDDFMTGDWARLPYDVLGRAATRIVNEVQGVNRVVYDITSKPPATIEWE